MNIYSFLKKVYRLTLNINKQETFVWQELKRYYSNANLRFGVFEKEKYIEIIFEIEENTPKTYFIMIYDGYLNCRVKIIEEFPVEITTELFILAAHFNNILNDGKVIVNVNNKYIEYHTKNNLLVPLLYTGEIHNQIISHYNTSKDVFWAFNRLISTNEAPAIIISDLLGKLENTQE